MQHSNIFHITSGKLLKNSLHTTYIQQEANEKKWNGQGEIIGAS
jgi:hypothetical protein